MDEEKTEFEKEKDCKYTIRIHGKPSGLYTSNPDKITSEIVRKAISHFYEMQEKMVARRKKQE